MRSFLAKNIYLGSTHAFLTPQLLVVSPPQSIWYRIQRISIRGQREKNP